LLPINNSDTAWLIVSDYNQDNAIGYPDYLREDIDNPDVNDWHVHTRPIGVGTIGKGNRISSANVGDYSRMVGMNLDMQDGSDGPGVSIYSDYVGGNRS
jgi:hypothetical protein